MKTRYMKVIRDLTSDYTKNLMLVLAIAIGVFGIGSVLGGYSVIKREMTDNYLGTVPASATIEVEDSIPASLIRVIEGFPGISEAERHATIQARMKVGERWHPLLLFVVDDFAGKRINQITSISGVADPPVGTMLVERTAFVVMEAKEGDEILIKTPNGEPRKIKLTGTVHDPGLAPAWQEEGGYGYITLSTLHWLGETQGFDQLRLLVSEHPDSREQIIQKAASVADWLQQQGYPVHEIQVPPPGKHPHQSQMNAVMSIFIVFSFMILILGSVLVSTSMATLMVRQVRQIGIMKTIGANSYQIGCLYFLMMILICVIALLGAIPLSQLAAAGFYQQIAALLNLEIRNTTIPLWVPLLQVGSGIAIPLAAAAFPVVRGSRISIRQALDNYGVSQKNQLIGLWFVRLSRLRFLGETLLLSIRNVVRQRARLTLTLGLLAAGGGMFMTALNVSEAWEDNLSRIYIQRLYDLEIRLNHPMPEDSILQATEGVTGITGIEGWSQTPTSFVNEESHEVTHTYPDKGHGSFTLQALPIPTRMLAPEVVEGRWLSNQFSNEVVLNQLARGLSSGVKIGDRIKLTMDEKTTEWKVVGFTEDVGTPATAYVPLGAYRKFSESPGMINMFRIACIDRSKAYALQKNREVEELLERKQVSISATIPVWLLHNAVAAHMEVLINSLLAMAILMGLVGILGLMSTMSMNVMERTKEIGVMRAIGATPGKIKNIVTGEGFIIGGLSIFFAFLLALILSYYMGFFIGNMAFRTPLSLILSVPGLLIWMLMIGTGSYIATLYPARRAGNVTTHKALAYE